MSASRSAHVSFSLREAAIASTRLCPAAPIWEIVRSLTLSLTASCGTQIFLYIYRKPPSFVSPTAGFLLKVFYSLTITVQDSQCAGLSGSTGTIAISKASFTRELVRVSFHYIFASNTLLFSPKYLSALPHVRYCIKRLVSIVPSNFLPPHHAWFNWVLLPWDETWTTDSIDV